MAKVKYQALFHNDEMGVFITDDKFRLSYCNEALRLKKLFLYDEKLVGKDVYELFYTIRVIVTHFEVFDQLRVKIGEKSKDSIQLTYTTITNELVKLHYSPLWNQDVYKGGIWLVYFTEDNAPSESENQFTHIDMDSLIQTEEMFYSMLREIQSSKRKDDVICLIAIDDYSVYKSHYGTLNVKSCKQKISKIIKTELKNRSYGIYRVGDDKLALSIKHIDPHLVAPLLESIQKRIRDERIVHEFATMFPILTVSISVVCSQSLLNERTTGEVEDLLYKYLEQCKKKGGNCYIISPFLYGI